VSERNEGEHATSDRVRTATAGATDAAPLNAVSGAEDAGAFRVRDLVDSGLRVMASSGDTIRAATSLSGQAVRILAGRSTVEADKGDGSFADPTWERNRNGQGSV